MSDDDRTIDAGPDMLDELRRLAAAAEADPTAPGQQATGRGVPDPSDRGAPALRPTRTPHELEFDDDPTPPSTSTAATSAPPVARPDAASKTQPWRPPSRSLLPGEPVVTRHDAARRWRRAAFVLAAIAAVLAGVIALGAIRRASDEAPPTEPAPADSTPTSGVPPTGADEAG